MSYLYSEIEEFEVAGLQVVLWDVVDDTGEYNPRQYDALNHATLACWHKRVDLGDVQLREQREWGQSKVDVTVGFGRCVALQPLYLYQHGGMTMNTTGYSCPFDSGQIGWGYITAEHAEQHGMVGPAWTPERYRAVIDEEVENYDRWLRDEIYGYRLTDAEGNSVGGDDGYLDLYQCTLAAQEEALEYAGMTRRSKIKPAPPVRVPVAPRVRVPSAKYSTSHAPALVGAAH